MFFSKISGASLVEYFKTFIFSILNGRLNFSYKLPIII